jgi:hypothetical protein
VIFYFSFSLTCYDLCAGLISDYQHSIMQLIGLTYCYCSDSLLPMPRGYSNGFATILVSIVSITSISNRRPFWWFSFASKRTTPQYHPHHQEYYPLPSGPNCSIACTPNYEYAGRNLQADINRNYNFSYPVPIKLVYFPP